MYNTCLFLEYVYSFNSYAYWAASCSKNYNSISLYIYYIILAQKNINKGWKKRNLPFIKGRNKNHKHKTKVLNN